MPDDPLPATDPWADQDEFAPQPSDDAGQSSFSQSDSTDEKPMIGLGTPTADAGTETVSAEERERVEQSFDTETGRYRRSDGEFAEGSPPNDYNSKANRFQSEDGTFKSRSADLGAGTKWDAPEDDADSTFDGGLFDY